MVVALKEQFPSKGFEKQTLLGRMAQRTMVWMLSFQTAK